MPEKLSPIAVFRGVLKKVTVGADVTIVITTRWQDELVALMPLQGRPFRLESSLIEFLPEPEPEGWRQTPIEGYEPPKPAPPPPPKRNDGKTLDELFGPSPWTDRKAEGKSPPEKESDS